MAASATARSPAMLLLFMWGAYFLNYCDRQAIFAIFPVLKSDLGLTDTQLEDPKRFDAVVVKSPHCQPHMFEAWCARMVNVDAPGATSANLRSLGHTRCRRPVFPLDPNVSFSPEVRVFQRPRYQP